LRKPLVSGPFGAGVSARSGKVGEPGLSSPSGLGSYGLERGGLKLAALAVVNSLGSVIDHLDGRVVSGLRTPEGGLADREGILETLRQKWPSKSWLTQTVLVAVATNARLTKLEAHRLAVMASSGISRAIYPSNTLYDGDAVFALTTGDGPSVDPGWLGALAADVVARAILESALAARGED
jgi:L-aminopeptidase/D-esterase-like protein